MNAVLSYLRRFFTCWVVEDPAPAYSTLDPADGLVQLTGVVQPKQPS